ncbi:hypothetical protein N7535_001208 [Penicillium sp. DV-2018c]|nr:hypothetical protein N7535_001208 [Penicillium sp. DV-2018c]
MAPPKQGLPPQEGSFLSHTPERFFSATDFTTESDFHTHVLEMIRSATHHEKIIYTQVPPAWGSSVFEKHYNAAVRTLWIRIMPTEIHDCHQVWVRDEMARWQASGALTYEELLHLRPLVGTTIEFQHAPYAGSRKEPDFLMRPVNQRLPTLVMESGWSESFPRLLGDLNLWLVGGAGAVNAIIILQWQTITGTNRVGGTAELYTPDMNGTPVMRQRELVFPAPSQSQTQEFRLTRRMLFTSTIFPGRNPDDVITLKLDRLRVVAADGLSLMGLVPA